MKKFILIIVAAFLLSSCGVSVVGYDDDYVYYPYSSYYVYYGGTPYYHYHYRNYHIPRYYRPTPPPPKPKPHVRPAPPKYKPTPQPPKHQPNVKPAPRKSNPTPPQRHQANRNNAIRPSGVNTRPTRTGGGRR